MLDRCDLADIAGEAGVAGGAEVGAVEDRCDLADLAGEVGALEAPSIRVSAPRTWVMVRHLDRRLRANTGQQQISKCTTQ